MRRRLQLRLLVGAAIAMTGGLYTAPSIAATTCTVKNIQAASPKDTTIVSAEKLDKPATHCKVEGYVTTNDPVPNKVNFRLQLPDKKSWNKRYYFIGLGGTAGYVPTDSQIPSGNPLVKGFVVAGTDTGHQYGGGDWSFMGREPAKAIDHKHRGAHVTTVASQQITKAYYGVDKFYRYHSGCSGGGRMGSEAMVNHPEDYDGILFGTSGARSHGMSAATMLKFIHASQQMTREPGSWVSPAKLKMLDEKITAACDMTDGAKDDMIWDHRLCKYDVAKLKCKKGDAPDCLTEPEIKSIKAILNGPRGPKGELLSEPMPISNISSWSFLGAVPPPWSPDATMQNRGATSGAYMISNTMARSLFGPTYDVLKDFHFTQADLDAWQREHAKIGYGVPLTDDWRPYEKTGGKVIMWGGVSDSCCSNVELEQYVHDVTKVMDNDASRVAEFVQLYEFPGMGHCGGGTGPQDAPDQLLQVLMDWVEQGKTPGPVVAHRGKERAKLMFADINAPMASGVVIPPPAGGARDFLVCPFPQVSVFDKSKADVPGAVLEAANWSCRASR